MNNICFPAEWDRDAAIMIAWPHENTDWAYMLDEVTECYTNLVKAFVSKKLRVIIVAPDSEYVKTKLKGIDSSDIIFYEVDTNDTWTRDYGPITIEQEFGLSRHLAVVSIVPAPSLSTEPPSSTNPRRFSLGAVMSLLLHIHPVTRLS